LGSEPRRVVVGTAGHIDHGKTALVRALTGIDTDRLPEEKRRGITIELGFAHLDLGDGTVAGLVDVPGHERFVRAMAAGAGGVDLALLVVAADEGVMPQTREHVDILRLLGIAAGVVVITKADLLAELGPGWLPLLQADLDALCEGTFLESAPRVAVSARTGQGLPELTAALRTAAAAVPARSADGPLLLPVDRAFTLKGFGTVVTGTLLSGTLATGDEVDLVPGGGDALRVRGLQVHGAPVERALAGQRTAVNLAAIEAAQVPRGAALAEAGRLPATPMLDVELTLLPGAPAALRHRARFLLHMGTDQVPALVALLDREELAAGDTAPAQLRLARRVAALPGQRFVLRGFQAVAGRGRTVAGGKVLAILPRKRRRGRADALEGIAALQQGDPVRQVERVLLEAGAAGLDLGELGVRTALPGRAVQKLLEQLGARGLAVCHDRVRRAWISTSVLERLARKARVLIEAHHERQPLSPGLPREELRVRLAIADPRVLARVVAVLTESGVETDGDVLRLAGHTAAGADRQLPDRIGERLLAAGLTPPDVSELSRTLGEPEARVLAALRLLEGEGRAARVSAELYFDPAALTGLRERLVAFLVERGEISTQEFKELVGASRKWVIPLGEHFDREKVTLRVGDARRVLRAGSVRERA
jgi:selenocysteine-specific elongation factor